MKPFYNTSKLDRKKLQENILGSNTTANSVSSGVELVYKTLYIILKTEKVTGRSRLV